MRLPRFWVIEIVATIGGQHFNDWVEEACAKRNDKVAEKKNMFMEMDPTVAQILA